ncbi:hypothetical protein EDC94DRAFT_179478 [Helicostylum pulchrum]|nr:hypothetical protein EDC94DRAFT_179478 [Helicostylum pulchrum]
MRLRRIIAAFLRERANSTRKRKMQEKVEKKENDRQSRQRQKESRAAQRQRTKQNEVSNRWTKKNKSDFLKTLMSFGVERDEDDFQWARFKEIAGLEKKTDDSLTLHYRDTYAACEDAVKRYLSEGGLAAPATGADVETPVSSPKDNLDTMSRESSVEPNDGNKDDADTLVPYDKARRALKRIEQMNTIREKVIVHPDLDQLLLKARKTSGLPSWWEVPKHDKALLEAICKHGIGRTDLIVDDPELPFYHVKQTLLEDGDETEDDDEKKLDGRFVWPRDLVVARRIDSLCDLVLNPKPLTIRQTRKRKSGPGSGVDGRKKNKSLQDEDEEEEEEVTATTANLLSSPAADDYSELSHEEPQNTNQYQEPSSSPRAEEAYPDGHQTQYQADSRQTQQYHASQYVDHQYPAAAAGENQHTAGYQVEPQHQPFVEHHEKEDLMKTDE